MESLRLPRPPATAATPHDGGRFRRCRATRGEASMETSSAPAPTPQQQRRFWPRWRAAPDAVEPAEAQRRSRNWVMKMLTWRSPLGEEELLELRENGGGEEDEDIIAAADAGDRCLDCGSDGCDVSGDYDDAIEFDRESFSKFLQSVSLMEAKLYAKLAYLATMAYHIPKIKPASLLKFYGLQFVTSSLEIRAKSVNLEDPTSIQEPESEENLMNEEVVDGVDKDGYRINRTSAYKVAVSAASYIQSQTKGLLPFKSKNEDSTEALPGQKTQTEVDDTASCTSPSSIISTSDSATAVVAEEEIQQAVSKDMNVTKSSPCQWFICDDNKKGTRYFIIQGSESLASWQANLVFEPIQFESLDVLVHRGIYEAANKIYEEMLPEIRSHLESYGNFATFRFAGHSLGGSLSILINLMLLIRGDVPRSSLLPVVTFGAPCIFCGSDNLLRKLGLPEAHIQSIVMHRDIVPRAFSCNYPERVAQILQTVNGNFRKHPCLKHQKLLYAPIGKLLILQPEENLSPNHQFLPTGSGLYLMANSLQNSQDTLRAARSAFLNSPHPLEVLSKRAAYSSRGIVRRNHHVLSYLKTLYGLVHKEQNLMKAKRGYWARSFWPTVDRDNGPSNAAVRRLFLSGVVNRGKETLKKLGKIVVSGNVNMLVVLLLPARGFISELLSNIDLHR